MPPVARARDFVRMRLAKPEGVSRTRCMLAPPPMDPAERANRVEAVHAWQRYLNMEPRADSKLTGMFADGHVYMTAEGVARELVATDYIYKHTLYGELIEAFLRGVADELRSRHPNLSWTATWEIVRFYGPIALKLMLLSAAGERIPEAMP